MRKTDVANVSGMIDDDVERGEKNGGLFDVTLSVNYVIYVCNLTLVATVSEIQRWAHGPCMMDDAQASQNETCRC